eukprot:COSAG05_NODE_1163_length_5656_cov_2.387979_2_plen_80_part_00
MARLIDPNGTGSQQISTGTILQECTVLQRVVAMEPVANGTELSPRKTRPTGRTLFAVAADVPCTRILQTCRTKNRLSAS